MFRGRNYIEESAARFQDPEKFLQSQRGEAVQENIDALIRDWQMIGGCNGEFDLFLTLRRVPQNKLGNISAGHPRRFSGGKQSLIDTGCIISFTAAGIQKDRGIPGPGQDLTAKSIQQWPIIAFGEKITAGSGHSLVVAGSGGMLLVGRKQMSVAFLCKIIAVAVGTKIAAFFPDQGDAADGTAE